MKAFFAELDGTTFEQAIPWPPSPLYYMPIVPRLFPWEEPTITAAPRRVKTARYDLQMISEDIAFYDRVVDAEELAWD